MSDPIAEARRKLLDHLGEHILGTIDAKVSCCLALADAYALAMRAEPDDILHRLCRTHNVRGEDGPCDCEGCRYFDRDDVKAVPDTLGHQHVDSEGRGQSCESAGCARIGHKGQSPGE